MLAAGPPKSNRSLDYVCYVSRPGGSSSAASHFYHFHSSRRRAKFAPARPQNVILCSALLLRLSCQARSPPDNTQARPRTKHTHLSVCLFVTRTSAKQRAMSWPGWLAGCPAKTIRTVGESGRKGAGLARDIQAWPVRRLTQTRKTHSQIHVLVLGPVGNVALPRALTAVRNSGNVRRCLKCRHLHRLTYALAPMAHICIEVRNGARVRATRNKRALRLVRCVHVSAPASVWACVRVCGNPSGSSCEKSSI